MLHIVFARPLDGTWAPAEICARLESFEHEVHAMTVEIGLWRLKGDDASRLASAGIDLEKRLEEVLARDISIASPNWMVIGRQVVTAYGKKIDLLSIDADGNLVALELKRDLTPRDAVAQLLDYGCWIRDLDAEQIRLIFQEHQTKASIEMPLSLDEAFRQRFDDELPEELNESHQLVLVAASIDQSSERILDYLTKFSVPVNAVFFRVFRDEATGAEFLSRAWHTDPVEVEVRSVERKGAEPWNDEYYASFGEGTSRRWVDAVKLGFISAGGGEWHSQTMRKLEPGKRVWVNIPGTGYVGVGRVKVPGVRVSEFERTKPDGSRAKLTPQDVTAVEMFTNVDGPALAEYVVAVEWEKTVPVNQAIREKGLFGSQHSACAPTTPKWSLTVARLRQLFGVR